MDKIFSKMSKKLPKRGNSIEHDEHTFEHKILSFTYIFAFFVLSLTVLFSLKPIITGMVPFTGNSDYLNLANGQDIMFVDQNNLDCDDSHSRNQAMNGNTPWCNIQAALSKMTSGDTVYILEGIYRTESIFQLNNRDFASKTTLTAYPDNEPIITSSRAEYDTTGNGEWTSLGNNIWTTEFSSTQDSILGAITATNTSLFTYSTDFSTHDSYGDLTNTNNPEGIYFDRGNSDLYLKYSSNPNNVAISLSDNPVFQLNNVNGPFEISNLIIVWGQKGIYIRNSDDIIVANNVFKGAFKAIDIRLSSNIEIIANEVFMNQGNGWTWDDDIKSSAMETTGIWLEGAYEGIEISNNEVHGHFNGILLYSLNTGLLRDIKVHDNVIYNLYDDAIELEDYCNGAEIYNNNISDVFIGFSFSPTDSSEKECSVYNNLIIADKLVDWNHAGTKYYGECYKIIDNHGANDLNIHHNTCVGKGIYTTTSKYNTQSDNSWTNNIFYSKNNGRALDKSGLALDDVFYDHNIYYRPGGGSLFRYWNDDYDSSQFYSVSQARSSGNWDHSWDVNSQTINPSFIGSGNYRPQAGSVACNMSSTGSYVGALPCMDHCSDNICNGDETCTSCPIDCVTCVSCGDGSCNGNEDCTTCSADCGICPSFCGDNTCDATENCSSCEDDCGVCMFCGDNICNQDETCTTCEDDCGACPLDCGNSICDVDETCANCAADCGICPPVCGDGTCDPNEDCGACSNDCGICSYCGDNVCDNNETCTDCENDCGLCPYCGDNTCDPDESCSSCDFDCGACKRSSGGGGGSSRRSIPKPIINTTIVEEKEPIIEAPTIINEVRTINIENEMTVRISNDLNIKIDDEISMMHVYSINRDSVDVLIDDQYVELTEDEPQTIKIGSQDLTIMLKSKSRDTADILLKRIELPPKPVTNVVVSEVKPEPIQMDSTASWPFMIVTSLIATGSLVVIWGSLRKSYK